MGKKNKKQTGEIPKKGIEGVIPKGGSTITKNKPVKSPQPVKQKNKVETQNNKKTTKQDPKESKDTKKKIKQTDVSEDKLKELAANLTGKTAKKRKRNKKQATNGEVVKKEEPKEATENETVTLSKRQKARLKCDIKKEIILKGKSKTGLADPNLVAKKLAKLKRKPEPLSKKVKRKIILLESLHQRLVKGEKIAQRKNGSKMTETPTVKAEKDSDEEMPETKKAKKQNGKVTPKIPEVPEKEENFLVFVGNLEKETTEEMIREHFKSAGSMQKIKIPPLKKKKKARRFAYIQFADETSKKKALELHGSTLGDKQITVLYADKNKGRSGLMSKNAKLNALRKTLDVSKKVSPTKKSKKKLKKRQAVTAAVVADIKK